MRRRPRVELRHFVQEMDHTHAWGVRVEHRLDLARVEVVCAEVSEEDDRHRNRRLSYTSMLQPSASAAVAMTPVASHPSTRSIPETTKRPMTSGRAARVIITAMIG